jgi:hypothetical protein
MSSLVDRVGTKPRRFTPRASKVEGMVRKIGRILCICRDAVVHEWHCAFLTTVATSHILQESSRDTGNSLVGAALPQHRVFEFTKHVGHLCTRREVDIGRLAERLTMNPTELLKMINGRLTPTNVVLSGWAPTCGTSRS